MEKMHVDNLTHPQLEDSNISVTPTVISTSLLEIAKRKSVVDSKPKKEPCGSPIQSLAILKQLVQEVPKCASVDFKLPNNILPGIEIPALSNEQGHSIYEIQDGKLTQLTRTCYICSRNLFDSVVYKCDYCASCYHLECRLTYLGEEVISPIHWPFLCPAHYAVHSNHATDEQLTTAGVGDSPVNSSSVEGSFSSPNMKTPPTMGEKKTPSTRRLSDRLRVWNRILESTNKLLVNDTGLSRRFNRWCARSERRFAISQQRKRLLKIVVPENVKECYNQRTLSILNARSYLSTSIGDDSRLEAISAQLDKEVEMAKPQCKPDETDLFLEAIMKLREDSTTARPSATPVAGESSTSQGLTVFDQQTPADPSAQSVMEEGPTHDSTVEGSRKESSGQVNGFTGVATEVVDSVSSNALSARESKIEISEEKGAGGKRSIEYRDIDESSLDDQLLQLLAREHLMKYFSNRFETLEPKATLSSPPSRSTQQGVLPSITTGDSSTVTQMEVEKAGSTVLDDLTLPLRAIIRIFSSKGGVQSTRPMTHRQLTIGSDSGCHLCLLSSNKSHGGVGSVPNTCRFVSPHHATIFYDDFTQTFELVNYSDIGCIVDGVFYCQELNKQSANLAHHSKDRKSNRSSSKFEARESANVDTKQRTLPLLAAYRDQSKTASCPCATDCPNMEYTSQSPDGVALLRHGSRIQIGCTYLEFSVVVQNASSTPSGQPPSSSSSINTTMVSRAIPV